MMRYAIGAVNTDSRAILPNRNPRYEGEHLDLESIKQQVKEEIEKLSQVLRLLEGGTNHQATSTGVRKKRKLSAAGRARIAAAQRARWAKIRAGKK